MFKKLVSNLPFHPSLLGQVSFYVYRLRQETAIRRAGLVLIALTLIVQIFAITSPSKSSLATSSGDIIYGATTREDVEKAYKRNQDPYGRTDIKAIFNYYGIGLEQINQSKFTHIASSDRTKYINTSRSTTSFPDTFVKIPGASDGGIYEFPLDYWRQSEFPNGYPALEGKSTYGFKFWILLKGCGNIVIEKGSKKPDLEIIKQRTSNPTVKSGDMVTYKIQFRNKGIVNATRVAISDTLADEFDYDSYKSNVDLRLNKHGQSLTWRINNDNSTLAPSDRWHTITVKVKARKIDKPKKEVCNASTIDANNAGSDRSDNNGRCVTIIKPTCPGTGLPIPQGGVKDCKINCPDGSQVPYTKSCKVPQLACESLEIIGSPDWKTRKFETTVVMQQGAVVKEAAYFVNNKKVSSKLWQDSSTTQNYTYTFSGPGTYEIRAEIVAKIGDVQESQNCTISETIEQPTNPQPLINTDKAVGNLTQKIADANNTVAKPGDILRYRLLISNTGSAPKTMELNGEYGESIADILEYSDLTDKGDANYNDKTHFLSWSEVTINPGQTIEKTFTVTVKNPLPATPASASNPLSFDYVLHNKYGRSVNVKLDKPASKIIEQTATTLPNTGPGTSMIISAIATVIFGYFFYRSRLLSKELELVHHEFSAGGI